MGAPSYRALLPPTATELSQAQTAQIAKSTTTTVTPISPQAANGRPIVGVKMIVTLTTTYSAAPTSSPGTVGDIMSELKILKSGNLTLLDPETYAQLQRIYHIYAGIALADAAIEPNATETITTTLETAVMPFYFTTAVSPQFTFYAAGYSQFTNCTAATVTVQFEFQYSNLNLVNDDQIVIVTTPTTLSADVQVSVNQYFTVKTPVNQVWVDATTDTNVTYETYEAGNTTVFDQIDTSTLKALERYQPYYEHMNGFFFSQTPTGVLYPSPGTTQGSTAPNLIYELANSVALVFYLVMAAQNPPV